MGCVTSHLLAGANRSRDAVHLTVHVVWDQNLVKSHFIIQSESRNKAERSTIFHRSLFCSHFSVVILPRFQASSFCRDFVEISVCLLARLLVCRYFVDICSRVQSCPRESVLIFVRFKLSARTTAQTTTAQTTTW